MVMLEKQEELKHFLLTFYRSLLHLDLNLSPSILYSQMASSSRTVSFFPTPALDHAFAGIGAGAVATICMNPLDLIKVKFQVDSKPPLPISLHRTVQGFKNITLKRILTGGKVGRDMTQALKEIVNRDGWKGLYRGLSPNVVGNSASWGLYFLWLVPEIHLNSFEMAQEIAELAGRDKVEIKREMEASSCPFVLPQL